MIYGGQLGSVDECAISLKEKALACSVALYGKQWEVQVYSQPVMLQTMRCPGRVKHELAHL